MYRVLKIYEAGATREMKLLNEETGTVDHCFDDSAVTSFKNFDFMRISGVYDCKIYLFGELDGYGENLTYIKNITVGNKDVSQICNEKGDVYYIDKIPAIEFLNKRKQLNYKYTRKDIIQVNDTIHPDFE